MKKTPKRKGLNTVVILIAVAAFIICVFSIIWYKTERYVFPVQNNVNYVSSSDNSMTNFKNGTTSLDETVVSQFSTTQTDECSTHQTTGSQSTTTKSTHTVKKQTAEDIVNNMSVEQKVGELFMIRANGISGINSTISKVKAGGVVLFAKDFNGKTKAQVISMINDMQSSSDGKMLVAVDEEGGTVVRVSSNANLRTSKFKSPQNLYAEGGFERIKSDTVEKCTLLRSLQINVNFAPVADVCTDPNGFMFKRAFGQDANATAEYVAIVVNEMNKNNIASCVKHFPGYGNSQSDTHNGLDVNTKSLEELNESDLVPFRRAIAYNVDSIMVTHTIINAIDSEHPASLSKKVVDMIRKDMNFNGVIVSDGLDMGAVIAYSGDSGKVCVMAVNAGIDLLCTPQNPVSDYNAVLAAVNSGEIPMSRINEAVTRIVKLKIKLGLYE